MENNHYELPVNVKSHPFGNDDGCSVFTIIVLGASVSISQPYLRNILIDSFREIREIT